MCASRQHCFLANSAGLIYGGVFCVFKLQSVLCFSHSSAVCIMSLYWTTLQCHPTVLTIDIPLPSYVGKVWGILQEFKAYHLLSFCHHCHDHTIYHIQFIVSWSNVMIMNNKVHFFKLCFWPLYHYNTNFLYLGEGNIIHIFSTEFKQYMLKYGIRKYYTDIINR